MLKLSQSSQALGFIELKINQTLLYVLCVCITLCLQWMPSQLPRGWLALVRLRFIYFVLASSLVMVSSVGFPLSMPVMFLLMTRRMGLSQ